ncbi:MAG TPA: HEAT repeat domain-containing protein [candidate division Zixibacteria bacterium]|nr:HEAT repeat domain-containing protein [candidate division Zixibacteria bacterium]
MSKEEQTKKLIERIKRTQDETIKLDAIDQLGEIGKRAKESVSLLIQLIKDSSESFKIRTKAIWSLGEIGSGTAVQPLIDLLQSDNNKYIRILSLESLGKISKRPEIGRTRRK